MAQGDDPAWISIRGPVYRPQTEGGEEGWHLQGPARPRKPEADQCLCFTEVEGFKKRELIDTVGEIGMIFQDLPEFVLSEDDDLKELVFVCFIIQKLAEDFPTEVGDFLPLVDNQDDRFFFVHALLKKIFFDVFLLLPLAFLCLGPGKPEGQCDCGEKFAGRAEIGIEDKVCLELIAVVFRFRKFADELPTEGRLTRSHVTHDDVETTTQTDGQLQSLEAIHMPR